VISADDGGTALFQTHHEDPDLNILDIVMLEMDIEEKLPEVEVDRDRTVSLLYSPVSDTLRYTAEGRVIQLSAHRSSGRKQVIVEDNCPGIPTGELPDFITRFY
jgi:signal transduction histidine kinase